MKHPINLQQPTSTEPPVLITTYLPILVFLDVMGVTLVIPLLQQYFKDAGIVHATQREMLNSVYSTSQIIGGLTLGALNDVGYLSPLQTLTYLSFLGSAISYALLAWSIQNTPSTSSLYLLIISRILVGFVKQTVTMTTAIVSKWTYSYNRSKSLSRLSVARTLASILGPTFGAFLYQHVGRSIPVWTASFIFLVNFFLAEILLIRSADLLQDHGSMSNSQHLHPKNIVQESNQPKYTWKSKTSSFMSYLNTFFQSKALSSVILSSLLYHFISSATSYANMTSYYEEKYGIQPYQRGYLSSYQSVWTLIVQTFLVHPLLIQLGGEATAACAAAGLLSLVTFLEMKSSLVFFLLWISPILAISSSLLSLSTRTLVTHVSPTSSLSSILATLDVLTNVVAVMVPIYRALLFRFVGCFPRIEDSETCLKGDPSPTMWLLSSGVHWMLTTIMMYFLLVHKKSLNIKVE